jgi:hypothetical protein
MANLCILGPSWQALVGGARPMSRIIQIQWSIDMDNVKGILQSVLVAALLVASTACVVEPRESYYDHDHHRYYHEHSWHDCGDHDDHCR